MLDLFMAGMTGLNMLSSNKSAKNQLAVQQMLTQAEIDRNNKIMELYDQGSTEMKNVMSELYGGFGTYDDVSVENFKGMKDYVSLARQVEEAEKKPVVKKKVTPKKATPKKVAPKKAVPKKGTPKKGTPEKPKKPPVKKKFDVSKAKKNPKALKRFITKTKLKTGEKNAKGEPKEVSLSSILSNKKHKLYKKALAMKNKFIEKDSKRLDKDEKSKTVRKKKSDTKASDDAGDALAAFFGRPK